MGIVNFWASIEAYEKTGPMKRGTKKKSVAGLRYKIESPKTVLLTRVLRVPLDFCTRSHVVGHVYATYPPEMDCVTSCSGGL